VIVKLIVEKFGGEISFASKWKKGTTFLFTFESMNFNKDEYVLSEIIK
jgi:signal transduction histidine kinase